MRGESGTITKNVFMNTGSGWSLSSDYIPPEVIYDHAHGDRSLQYSQLDDVNGDGLADYVVAMRGQGGTITKEVHLNKTKTFQLRLIVSGNTQTELTHELLTDLHQRHKRPIPRCRPNSPTIRNKPSRNQQRRRRHPHRPLPIRRPKNPPPRPRLLRLCQNNRNLPRHRQTTNHHL